VNRNLKIYEDCRYNFEIRNYFDKNTVFKRKILLEKKDPRVAFQFPITIQDLRERKFDKSIDNKLIDDANEDLDIILFILEKELTNK